MKLILACSLALLLVGSADAEEYLPLETGNFWSYRAEDGSEEMRVVGDPVPVLQGNPYPIEYPISPENQGLVNFWTSEPDGGVLLWGFWRDSWGIVYQPPVRMVDAPLFVGKVWPNTVDLYALPDTSFYMTMDFSFTVHEDPVMTVPAGEFPTYGIGYTDEPGKLFPGGRYTLWGEKITDKNRGADTWYSLGVGIVQEEIGDLLQLESYTDHPVGVEVSSWGAVKALYRGVN